MTTINLEAVNALTVRIEKAVKAGNLEKKIYVNKSNPDDLIDSLEAAITAKVKDFSIYEAVITKDKLKELVTKEINKEEINALKAFISANDSLQSTAGIVKQKAPKKELTEEDKKKVDLRNKKIKNIKLFNKAKEPAEKLEAASSYETAFNSLASLITTTKGKPAIFNTEIKTFLDAN